MAKINILTISFSLILLSVTGATTIETSSVYHHRSRPTSRTSVVEAQCRGTLYPRLCIECLSKFVSNSTGSDSPTAAQLAQIALRVSLVKARYTRSYIAKVAADMKQRKAKEYPVVKDCLDQINDGVDQITHSLKELGRMTVANNNNNYYKESVFSWHQNNVQTWMSTAITDALMCMDSGFPAGKAMGSKTKAIIRAKVLNVAQATSNALAFFNRFAARYKASRRATKP